MGKFGAVARLVLGARNICVINHWNECRGQAHPDTVKRLVAGQRPQ